MMGTILDIISLVFSLGALVISVILYAKQNENVDNIRFTDSFNNIYTDIFSLRSELSAITLLQNGYEFYYELDIINSKIEIEEKILDHLTLIENYFTIITNNKHNKVKKSFEKLVSIAFYHRIIALYCYVIFTRRKNNNEYMFKDYDEVIDMMKSMDKIKIGTEQEPDKCYIGIRESDIYFAPQYFKNSICLFSDNTEFDKFAVRQNQNITNKDIFLHYMNGLKKIKHGNSKYMFYNQFVAYNFPDNIFKNTICINSYEILEFLNNKLLVRQWLASHNIPIVAYETFLGKDILMSKLSSSFPKVNTYVVQSYRGGGGVGTYLFNRTNASEVREQLSMLQQYIVSPYVPSVSANIHIFISEKQTVLTPASIQIIELRKNQLCYRGCDFISFRELSNEVKNKIKNKSIEISQMLRSKGYRGIAGIDIIIDKEDNIYISEINPRFQASTILLDQYMSETANKKCGEASNTFELNEMAFSGSMISTLNFFDQINLSCYYYYNDENNEENYINKYKIYKESNVQIFADGALHYMNSRMANEHSYLYRVVFPHSISKVSPDNELWISNNIQIEPLPKDTLSLKIALLNQGVRINKFSKKLKKGTYNSIDIKLLTNNDEIYAPININCAYGIHHSQYSPFLIVDNVENSELFYYNNKICDIEIEHDLLSEFTDDERAILYMATDRLRIKLVSGCENKNIGLGCKFCNVPTSNNTFTIEQIINSLEHLKQNNYSFRHILIGGGSRLDKGAWSIIFQICNYLKKDDYYKEKPISLMSILPPEHVLVQLKEVGIQEVAFNIEIANETLARAVMPGKHKEGKEAYYDILSKAVTVFGIGNVRSALLVGLDKKEELYNEIITLAEMGVIPCLSAFRALPNSCFENELPPSNEYLLEVYNHSKSILNEVHGKINYLGPTCDACCNNMLKI